NGGTPAPDAATGGNPAPDAATGGNPAPDAATGGNPTPDAGEDPFPDAAVPPEPDATEPPPPRDVGVPPEPDAAPPPDDLLRDLQVDGAPWLRLGEPVRVSVVVDPAAVESFIEWTATIGGIDAAEIESQGESSIVLTPLRAGEMTLVAAVGGEQIAVTVFVYDCVDRDGDAALAIEGLPPAHLADAVAAGVCGPDAVDCDDGQLLIRSGRAEVCDGLDNDCDGVIDVGAPVDSIEHCGACETSCVRPNVEATCDAGQCRFDACIAGFVDRNGNLEDGCDVPDPGVCVPTGADDTCDGIDDDCDGAVDDDARDCADWTTGFCALRQARGVRDTVCEDFDTPLGTRWRRAFPYALTPSPFTQAGGRLAPADGRDEGISRSIPLTLAAFRVQFRAAVSNSTLLRVHLTVDDEVEDDGRPVGYMLQLEQNERVSLSTKLPLNPDFVQAEWSVPGLNDGRPRVFEWSREASGRPTLRVDGVLVASSPADPAGGVIAGLSRLAVGFVVPGAAGANDGVDNVVYSADLEGDGVLTPADNCPEITSADIVDADGDGRGRACDDLDRDGVEDGLDRCRTVPGEDCPQVGGHLLVSLAAGGSERLWRVDPLQGTRARFTPDGSAVSAGVADGRPSSSLVVTAEPAGEQTVIRGVDAATGEIRWSWFVTGTVGDLAQVSLPGQAVYFTDASDGALWRLDPATGDLDPWEGVGPRERVRIAASPEGMRIWVARFQDFGGIVLLDQLDAAFNSLAETVFVPDIDFDPLPALALSPAGDRLLFAGPSGIWTYETATATLSPFTAEPSHRAVFTGDGRSIASLAGDPPGLLLYPDGDAQGVTLIAPHAGLDSAVLSHVSGGALADADGNGLADPDDACPGVEPFAPRTGLDLGAAESDFAQVLVAGSEYLVSRTRQDQLVVRRFTPTFDPLGVEVFAPLDTDVAPAIAWDGTRFAAGAISRDDPDPPLQLLHLGLDLSTIEIAQHIQGRDEPRNLAGRGRTVALAGDPVQGFVFAYGNEVSLLHPDLNDAASRHRPGDLTGRADAPAQALFRAGERLFFAFEDGPNLDLGLAVYQGGLGNLHTSTLPGPGRASPSRQPAVAALDASRVVLLSVDAGRVVLRVPDAQWGLPENGTVVSNADRAATSPALAVAGGFYGAAWLERGSDGQEVWFRRIDADGTLRPPLRLSTPGVDAGAPSLSWDAENARFVGLWREGSNAVGHPRRLRATVGRFDCP
ncbi:hypothetical protein L6V77_19680, partial [Myxococcota bacterium]|nr:hypothetical protein [Myxococcota bacterium]